MMKLLNNGVNITMIKQNCYIFDLDGTLFDNSARDHLVPEDVSCTWNWTEWNQACHMDVLIEPIARIAHALHEAGYVICYVTSRCEDGWDETWTKMMSEKLPQTDNLLMRLVGDNRDVCEVKEELFKEVDNEYNVIAAFEDQQNIIDHMTELGYTMIKVGV